MTFARRAGGDKEVGGLPLVVSAIACAVCSNKTDLVQMYRSQCKSSCACSGLVYSTCAELVRAQYVPCCSLCICKERDLSQQHVLLVLGVWCCAPTQSAWSRQGIAREHVDSAHRCVRGSFCEPGGPGGTNVRQTMLCWCPQRRL